MQGLQVWDDNGIEVFNSSNRTLKVIRTLPMVASTNTVFYSDLFLQEEPTYLITPLITGDFQYDVQVSFDGNQCTVNIGDLANNYDYFDNSIIIIGVY